MNEASRLEIKKPIEKIHDLLNLSPEEKEILAKRVEKCGGLVRIFVHPLYENWRSDNDEDANYDPSYRDDIVKIEKALSKIIAVEEEKSPPLIIMEEAINLSQLKTWLESNLNKLSGKKIYIVETSTNNPAPIIKKDRNFATALEELTQSIYDPRNDPAWKKLEKTLKEIGVKKILLGGMQFEASAYKKDWTDKDPWVARCVGIAMSHLAKDKGGEFEVELSALTAPFSERRYFNEIKRKAEGKENKE